MASRPSSSAGSRGAGSPRPSGRSARAGSSGQQKSAPVPLLIGAGVVVVVVLVLVFQSGGGNRASAGESSPKVATPAAPAAGATAKTAGDRVQLGAAKAGKTPGRPAPALTQATLQELSDLLAQIKVLRNDAVTARTGNADNQAARAKMGEAKDLLDTWKSKVQDQLLWQESAQMEDWAQPAEYLALEKLYATFQRYENEVRKGGG